MRDDEQWLDELAAKRAARLAANAADQERRGLQDAQTFLAIAQDLPGLKLALIAAAQQQTAQFRDRLGFGPEVSCVYDPAGRIEVVCAIEPGARLEIELLPSALEVRAEFTCGEFSADRQGPGGRLRVADRRLQLVVDGEVLSPAAAMSGWLRPFFEVVATEF